MNNQEYRADIDGLRALAVLSVIFFHAGFSAFGGGFIGVDVFFVISGFLITRLIRNEVGKGVFSFSHFYIRRARRLLPALFFIYILCYLFAYLLFIPEHFERFGKALLSSVFSVSNVFFWQEADYFDTEAIFKPLLHTWSLSVEEQFYMFWPISLVYLLKQRKAWLAPLTLVIAGIISLALNQVFIGDHPTIFYLIPFRIFEFCIGAMMVWLVSVQPKKEILLELLLLLGLGIIMYCAMTYSKDMAFPSFNALAPCIGTALVIYSGTARYSGKLLSNRVVVFLGLISYSLYLTHWPILVFYKYYNFNTISSYETWCLLLLSFLLSVAMYYFIELPWRKGPRSSNLSPRQFAACWLAAALVIAYNGYHVQDKNGFPKRTSLKPISANFEQAMQYKVCDNGYGNCEPRDNKEINNPDFIAVGDSHTTGMGYLLGAIAVNHSLTIEKRWIPGCPPLYNMGDACDANTNKTLDSFIERKIKNVVLIGAWDPLARHRPADFILSVMKYTIKKLKNAGINVYVYGSIPLMEKDPATCFERPLVSSPCQEFMVPQDYNEQVDFNRRLKTLVLENGAKYLDWFALLCDPEHCRVGYEGLTLYADRVHLKRTNIGAYLFMKYAGPKELGFNSLFGDMTLKGK